LLLRSAEIKPGFFRFVLLNKTFRHLHILRTADIEGLVFFHDVLSPPDDPRIWATFKPSLSSQSRPKSRLPEGEFRPIQHSSQVCQGRNACHFRLIHVS